MTAPAPTPFVTPDTLLSHWQGHRRLTRRVIEAFPEEKLFTFNMGGMRSFGEMACELLAMCGPTVRGLATGEWDQYGPPEITSKEALLQAWDRDTATLDETWGEISPDRFQEVVTAFGQYTAPMHDLVLYVVDNEVHHRGQGYVYLRGLGIEPPPFWERN